ncbi:MAG: DHH family phosphoesterase, partial [Pseudomonadota bacterium]
MADFDLFNGDADGIFSLLQLRQVDPRPNAERVTGVKRDIKLFPRIVGRVGEGDRVTALDISMAKNTDALRSVLEEGADVFYCDHHQTGDIPKSDRLTVLTDEAKVSCTAFLIDGYLDQAKTPWAICGAYGDNFPTLAQAMASRADLSLPMGRLRELGELVNYNAYGLTPDDLHFHPSDLFEILLDFPDPMAFLDADHTAFKTLKAGYQADWDVAQSAQEIDASDAGQILSLPAVPASNRISGLFGNALVDEDPNQA